MRVDSCGRCSWSSFELDRVNHIVSHTHRLRAGRKPVYNDDSEEVWILMHGQWCLLVDDGWTEEENDALLPAATYSSSHRTAPEVCPITMWAVSCWLAERENTGGTKLLCLMMHDFCFSKADEYWTRFQSKYFWAIMSTLNINTKQNHRENRIRCC